jgi:hypothetical protein
MTTDFKVGSVVYNHEYNGDSDYAQVIEWDHGYVTLDWAYTSYCGSWHTVGYMPPNVSVYNDCGRVIAECDHCGHVYFTEKFKWSLRRFEDLCEPTGDAWEHYCTEVFWEEPHLEEFFQ